MNLKKSQEFIYFQNKARHYHNLRNARPSFDTSRPPTFTTLSPRKQPYFKAYDLQRQNEGITNRVSQILNSCHAQVQKHGYSRYNSPVLIHNKFQIDTLRQTQQMNNANKRISNKLLSAKPSIGNVVSWNKDYQNIKEIKTHISRYSGNKTSRATIDMSPSSFIPSHYRSFINNDKKHIPIQQLFQLPRLKKLRGSTTCIVQQNNNPE